MNAPDLDRLRSLWAEQGRRIDDSLVLDVDAVRASLESRTSAAFVRHRRWRSAGLVFGSALIAALGTFIAQHWGQWDWVAIAALLLPLLLAEFVVDLREWQALRRLDLDAPIMRVRTLLHTLRWRRLRLAKGYLLLSVLLWWPFVLVLFKGLLGADLLRHLPPIVLLSNFVVGLAFIPLAQLAAWALSRRYGHRPGWQRFLDDTAGRTWRTTSDEVAAREAFEAAVADGSLAHASGQLPIGVLDALLSLRRRLLAGILSCAGLVVCFGLFNAGHGGQVQLIVPGVLLLWAALAHMVVQILNREALARVTDVASLRDRLLAAIELRLRVARWTLALSPVLALLLAIVVLRLLGIDWWQVSTGTFVVAGVGALSIVTWLAWQMHTAPETFAPRVVERLGMGFVGHARRVLAILPG